MPTSYCVSGIAFTMSSLVPLSRNTFHQGGEALGVSLLFNQNAEPRALFVHKRLREYPLSGGPSTLRESVVRPEVAELAVRLLRALNWFGLAMVEFKVDPRDGVPKLMEVNPKLWGSLSLAIASGVDFPALLYRLAMRGDVHRCSTTGSESAADSFGLIPSTSWPTQIAFRLQPSFFRFGDPQTHGDIWDPDDPGPRPWSSGWCFSGAAGGPRFLRHVFRRSRPTPGAIRTSQDRVAPASIT